jgi:nucleoside-diphosphate-sugar epimerase
MHRILVTGGGLVGAYVAREFVESGMQVTLLDIQPDRTYLKAVIPGEIEVIEASILDMSRLNSLFEGRKFHSVVHTAGLLTAKFNINPWSGFQTNVGGTSNIAELAKRHNVQHLIFLSSLAVYDFALAKGEISEDHPKSPSSLYDHSKLMSENWLQACASDMDARITILRPSGIFGPGQFRGGAWMGKNIQSLVAAAIAAPESQFVLDRSIFGSNEYLYVKDAAHAVYLALTALPSRENVNIMNIGPGKVCETEELTSALRTLFPRSLFEVKQAQSHQNYLKRKAPLSIHRAKDRICYIPKYSNILEGLTDYILELKMLLEKGVLIAT